MGDPFCYWGKAKPKPGQTASWHPLVYHSLDVAAVAQVWLEADPSLARSFAAAFGATDDAERTRLRAWVLFFVALHDLGKFDIRYQLKAPEALKACWPGFDLNDVFCGVAYDHGMSGYRWFAIEYHLISGLDEGCEQALAWMAAVAGHHGDIHCAGPIKKPLVEDYVAQRDHSARAAWMAALEALFLRPAGLSLRDTPPVCSAAAKNLLAGFCTVVDWLGSDDSVFRYYDKRMDLPVFFQRRVALVKNKKVLARSGLLSAKVNEYPGIQAILPDGHNARGVQTVVDSLDVEPGLLLIEAPTGSGKTEAAMAYAWRLLDKGVANSVVFALPTQATANAMLSRVEALAEKLFPQGGANLVLAHGKSKYNESFKRLIRVGAQPSAQGPDNASAQCAVWLAKSRKRALLGQLGVYTIDHALLSVLPVRHNFVRGFGLYKSVLIIDEVHAYDSYMYCLLGAVLQRQRAAGGSAILLSATLPPSLRRMLLSHWQVDDHCQNSDYPLITHAKQGEVTAQGLPNGHRPPERVVEIECLALPDAHPDAALIDRIITAARAGARVAIVCNLVDTAQKLARALRELTSVPVDLFHARYRFMDRQEKEKAVMAHYGKAAARSGGRILVATQVVEQSLDLDFDWLITQICPVDLLFQRLGRLHRHDDDERPAGYTTPRCTVLTVDGDDYGLHTLIYGNTRVLWRTEQRLHQAPNGCISFPAAYREWINAVYQPEPWPDEPAHIASEYAIFRKDQDQRCQTALELVERPMTQFADEDANAAALTRDGEMNLSVLPVLAGNGGDKLLDGTSLCALPEFERAEVLDLNTVSVPAGWATLFQSCQHDEDGRVKLAFTSATEGFELRAGGAEFRYTADFGLERLPGKIARR